MHPEQPKTNTRPGLSNAGTTLRQSAVAGSPPASPTDSTDIVVPRAISMERLSLQINEQSPLLSPTHPGNGRNSLQLNTSLLSGESTEPKDESKSVWYMMLLTMGLIG